MSLGNFLFEKISLLITVFESRDEEETQRWFSPERRQEALGPKQKKAFKQFMQL